MAEPQEVVIVDKNGTEHVFPPGFDPAKAAQIVRQSSLRSGQPVAAKPETTNPSQAYWNSLGDTASRTLLGIGRGAVDTVNPVNAASGLAQGFRVMSGDPMAAMSAGQGVIDTAKGIAGGNPEIGGQAIGSLLMGLLLPKAGGVVSDLSNSAGVPSLHGFGDAAVDRLVKTIGIDPAALDLQATRMRLQAARSRTRQAQTLNELNDPMGLNSPEAVAARARAQQSYPPTPAPETARAGGPVRGMTPEVGAQSMADAITEAATRPGANVKLTQWQQQFLNSINEQVKAGGRISPRQAQILAEMYSTFGLAK